MIHRKLISDIVQHTTPQTYFNIGMCLVMSGMLVQINRLTNSHKNLYEMYNIFRSYMQIDFQEDVDTVFNDIVENLDDTT